MIRVILKNGDPIEFELGDEKKEIDLVLRFHHGLDGETVLNLKTGRRGLHSRIKVSEIKNMLHVKSKENKTTDDDSDSNLESRFKTREEYEKWKRQKMREKKQS